MFCFFLYENYLQTYLGSNDRFVLNFLTRNEYKDDKEANYKNEEERA